MKEEFNIVNHIIKIDVQATIHFYQTQNSILDDCTCNDCSYFYHDFIHKSFSVFDTLRRFGVDLGKNLNSEPTGVWCVREDNGKVVHIFQVYQVIGHFADTSLEEIHYSITESDLNFNIKLIQSGSDNIDIELRIEEEEPNKTLSPFV